MNDLNHLHLLVTAFVDNPPLSAEAGEDWLRHLVKLVDMKILMDAQAIYCEDLGNEGVTGIVGLTTSHAAFHAWHEVEKPFVSFDLYSCRNFDINVVFDHLKEWGMTKCSYLLVDRNPDLETMNILGHGIFIPNIALEH